MNNNAVAGTAQSPNVSPCPGIMDINLYNPGKPPKPADSEPVHLCSNESPFGPSPHAQKAYLKAVESLGRYPDGTNFQLRDALSEYYGLDPFGIICASGSEDLLRLIAKSFVGPGDEAVYSQYGFMVYRIATIAAGGTPVAVDEPEMTVDVDRILNAVTERVKVVFIANPNNPTGTYLPYLEIQRLAVNLPSNVLLVIDGAYSDFVEERSDYSFGHELLEQGNVIITRTFSKLYGLASIRLGWAVSCKDIADVLYRNQSAFPVSNSAQQTGIAALHDRGHVDTYKEFNSSWLKRMSGDLSCSGLQVTPSSGNFLLVHFPHGAEQADRANAHLHNEHIITRDMKPYGLPQSLRITVGRESENIMLINSLSAFMQSEG